MAMLRDAFKAVSGGEAIQGFDDEFNELQHKLNLLGTPSLIRRIGAPLDLEALAQEKKEQEDADARLIDQVQKNLQNLANDIQRIQEQIDALRAKIAENNRLNALDRQEANDIKDSQAYFDKNGHFRKDDKTAEKAREDYQKQNGHYPASETALARFMGQQRQQLLDAAAGRDGQNTGYNTQIQTLQTEQDQKRDEFRRGQEEINSRGLRSEATEAARDKKISALDTEDGYTVRAVYTELNKDTNTAQKIDGQVVAARDVTIAAIAGASSDAGAFDGFGPSDKVNELKGFAKADFTEAVAKSLVPEETQKAVPQTSATATFKQQLS
ncbi:MAG: hypothetical protein ACT4OY_08550 [Alphaproteobacteria bacterium]